MKFKRITVTKNECTHSSKDVFGGTEFETLIALENHVISTYDEEKSFKCENEIFIMDKEGRYVLIYVQDVRMVSICADHITFTGYLNATYKKFKRGLKVNIHAWN